MSAPRNQVRCTTPVSGSRSGRQGEDPAGFPLPAGMLVVGSETRSDGRLIVYGVSPDGVKTVLADLQKGLPAAGYTPKEGEVEEHDAESNWEGHGYRGRWEIRELPGCDADTTVTVLAQKQG